MRRIILSFLFLAVLYTISTKTSFAAVRRYATCDACGLCPTIDVMAGTCEAALPQIPGDWGSCAKCLYPSLYPTGTPLNPSNCATLEIKEDNTPVYPIAVDQQFTMLGCISSGAGFASPTGAPTFVQVLLNVLFSLAGGLAFLYLMYGGYIILTSQADPERLNYGRRLIYGAIAGLIITISSVFIVNFVGSGVLKIPGFTGIAPTPAP